MMMSNIYLILCDNLAVFRSQNHKICTRSVQWLLRGLNQLISFLQFKMAGYVGTLLKKRVTLHLYPMIERRDFIVTCG